MPLGWRKYYWNLFRQFGREFYRTWRREFLVSLASAVVAGVIEHLIYHSSWESLTVAIYSAVIVLTCFALWHFIRSPWLIQKEAEIPNSWYGFIGLAAMVGLVLGGFYLGVILYRAHPLVVDMAPAPPPVPIIAAESRYFEIDPGQLKQLLTANRAISDQMPAQSQKAARLSTDILRWFLNRMENEPRFPPSGTNGKPPTIEQNEAANYQRIKFENAVWADFVTEFGTRLGYTFEDAREVGIDTKQIQWDCSQSQTVLTIQKCGVELGSLAQRLK
jgi:hypothetical protein